MKLRAVLASFTFGFALLAACSSGDPVLESPGGDDDDGTSGGGFEAGAPRRDSGTDAAKPEGDAGETEPDATVAHDAGTDSSAPHDAGKDAAPSPCGCDDVPDPICNGKDVVSYAASACVDASCNYPATPQTCEHGCRNGACSTAALSYLGKTAVFITGGAQISIGFTSGGNVPTVPSSATVTVTTQTFAPGTVRELHLFYDTDSNFGTKQDLVMTYDHPQDANDQWYGILPAQASGKQVYFYLEARPWVGESKYDPGNLVNLTYKVQD